MVHETFFNLFNEFNQTETEPEITTKHEEKILPQEMLSLGIIEKNLTKVKESLKNGASLRQTFGNEKISCFAMRYFNEEIMDYLTKEGVSIQDSAKISKILIETDNVEAFEWYIKKRKNFNICNFFFSLCNDGSEVKLLKHIYSTLEPDVFKKFLDQSPIPVKILLKILEYNDVDFMLDLLKIEIKNKNNYILNFLPEHKDLSREGYLNYLKALPFFDKEGFKINYQKKLEFYLSPEEWFFLKKINQNQNKGKVQLHFNRYNLVLENDIKNLTEFVFYSTHINYVLDIHSLKKYIKETWEKEPWKVCLILKDKGMETQLKILNIVDDLSWKNDAKQNIYHFLTYTSKSKKYIEILFKKNQELFYESDEKGRTPFEQLEKFLPQKTIVEMSKKNIKKELKQIKVSPSPKTFHKI